MTVAVWLRKDLRVNDHAAITAALKSKQPLLLVYIHVHASQDPTSAQDHVAFINESLLCLNERLAKLGLHLTYRTITAGKSMMEVWESLQAECAAVGSAITAIHSHDIVPNQYQRRREESVMAFARKHIIEWHQHPATGVMRDGKRSRKKELWLGQWKRAMNAKLVPAPTPEQCKHVTMVDVPVGAIPSMESLGYSSPSTMTRRQFGGEAQAEELLQSFIADRGQKYYNSMSSPNTAWQGCLRLSPHLTFGCVSHRYVWQTLQGHAAVWRRKAASETRTAWLKSINSVCSRLRWRSHFLQKLVDRPDMETNSLHRAVDAIRPNPLVPDQSRSRTRPDGSEGADEEPTAQEKFERWCTGTTGYPYVDACMRCLIQTGWLNFRARAMLVSFGAYDLWLHWPALGKHLLKVFLDYEPGIHYPQLQMQSGATGYNTMRVYSVVKQSKDHDPKGVFIRRYVPELEHVPNKYIHEPWTMTAAQMTEYQCVVGLTYPSRVVSPEATQRAKQAVGALRKSGQLPQPNMKAIRSKPPGSKKATRSPAKTNSRQKQGQTSNTSTSRVSSSQSPASDLPEAKKAKVYTLQEAFQRSHAKESTAAVACARGHEKCTDQPMTPSRQTAGKKHSSAQSKNCRQSTAHSFTPRSAGTIDTYFDQHSTPQSEPRGKSDLSLMRATSETAKDSDMPSVNMDQEPEVIVLDSDSD